MHTLDRLNPHELAEVIAQVLPLAGGADERAAFLQRVEHLRQYVQAMPLPPT